MKSSMMKLLKRYSITLLLLILSLIIIGLISLLLSNSMPPQVPLFYSRPNGDDQIVDVAYLSYIPISMVIIILINIYISRFIFTSNIFVRRI